MRTRSPLFRLAPVALTFALLDGCASSRIGIVASANGPVVAGFSGQVLIPSALASSLGIAVTPGITASYRLHTRALSQVPDAAAYVYLTDPSGAFYTYQGQKIGTTTDANGNFELPAVLPANLPVIVNAALPGNQRLVGYAFSQNGTNQVNVSLASTFAVEFLRQEAAYQNKSMMAYDVSQLASAISQTQGMLDAGTLAVPASGSLTPGYAAQLDNTYLAAFGTSNQTMSNLWSSMLGFRPIAVTTYAGNGALSSPGGGAAVPATGVGIQGPAGMVTAGTAGSFTTYLMQWGGNDVDKIDPNGNLTTLFTAFSGDPTVDGNTPIIGTDSGSGLVASTFLAPKPRLAAVDPAGNLVFVPMNSGATDNHLLLVYCTNPETAYGRTMTAGNVYRLGASQSSTYGSRTYTYGYAGDGSTVYPNAKFRYIMGLAMDDGGNLFVADRYNNVIRRIDHATGTINTIAGVHQTPDSDFDLNPPGYPGTTFSGDGGAANQAVFYWPDGLAWRRVNASTEELYVVDSLNDRIRKITATSSGTGNATVAQWQQGVVSTVVGTGVAGYSGDGGPANLAQIHVANLATHDESSGGLALDAANGYLYFVDDDNFVLRMVNLADGTIRTVAGTGSSVAGTGISSPNGDALHLPLGEPYGVTVAPDGSVLLSDFANDVVRRVWTQWGYK